MEEESYALKESEQQVEDKDEDAVTENSAMIKATKKPAKARASRRGKKSRKTNGWYMYMYLNRRVHS